MWYKNKVEFPNETIFEIVSKEDNCGFGLAVADIVKSDPHYHNKTKEIYTLVEGCLIVHLGNDLELLHKPGQTLEIHAGTVHWAKSADSTPARISVLTIPAWTPEDHFLVK